MLVLQLLNNNDMPSLLDNLDDLLPLPQPRLNSINNHNAPDKKPSSIVYTNLNLFSRRDCSDPYGAGMLASNICCPSGICGRNAGIGG
jgi:hypothetical protein